MKVIHDSQTSKQYHEDWVDALRILNEVEAERDRFRKALDDIYMSSFADAAFDNKELALARWEIAAKALGKL